MRLSDAGKFWLAYLACLGAFVGLALYSFYADAQGTQPATCTNGAANAACLTWEKPTQDINGNALTGPVTINIYAGKDGAPKTLLFSGVTATSALHTNLTPGNHCYEATAFHAGLESARTSEVCKSIAFAAPKNPTGFTVK